MSRLALVLFGTAYGVTLWFIDRVAACTFIALGAVYGFALWFIDRK